MSIILQAAINDLDAEYQLGRYPSRGDYEHCFTLETPRGEFIQLTATIVEHVARAIVSHRASRQEHKGAGNSTKCVPKTVNSADRAENDRREKEDVWSRWQTKQQVLDWNYENECASGQRFRVSHSHRPTTRVHPVPVRCC